METHGIYPPSEDNSSQMVDVSSKDITLRKARATGRIQVSLEIIEKIKSNTIPKGDVFRVAEVAGILAAKKTPEIIPLCHPILIESVRIHCEIKTPHAIEVTSEVIAQAKTGVEMEALVAVQAALLCIYDMTKGLYPYATIEDVHVVSKTGGKSEHWPNPKNNTQQLDIKVGILTVSDRCSKGKQEDKSGKTIECFFTETNSTLIGSLIVPDDVGKIQSAIKNLAFEEKADLIITTGGTGLGPRDQTPLALQTLWTKPLPGVGELLRSKGSLHTPLSWLSQMEAGLIENTLVVSLPGSPKAVKESLDILSPLLVHIFDMIRGENHEGKMIRGENHET